MQIFQKKQNVTLCGLVRLLDNFECNNNTHTFLTIELPKQRKREPECTYSPSPVSVLVLRHELPGNSGLISAQRISLQEPGAYANASFAALPSGNVLCSLPDFESVYELRRSAAAFGAFDERSKAHPMPERVRRICSSEAAGGEWRLVSLLLDNSVRLFRMTSAGELEAVGKLSAPAVDWIPESFASEARGLLFVSNRLNAASTSTGVEVFFGGGGDSGSGFSSSHLLFENSGILCLLQATRKPSGRVALVAFDSTNEMLVVYEFSELCDSLKRLMTDE